ncbi:hypothetical protein [Reichenbachiella sp. MALMAid0571]|uniref:hypothetical protein n=1 Tax=Reichenbachiella sp. MALMAid0571 TaxID=3143939 RepID=UPI0032DED614
MLLKANEKMNGVVKGLLKKRILYVLLYTVIAIVITLVVTRGINYIYYWSIVSVFCVVMISLLRSTVIDILRTIVFSIEFAENEVVISFYPHSFFGISAPNILTCDMQYLWDYQEGEKSNYGFDSSILFTANSFVKSVWGLKQKKRRFLIIKEFYDSDSLKEIKSRIPVVRPRL